MAMELMTRAQTMSSISMPTSAGAARNSNVKSSVALGVGLRSSSSAAMLRRSVKSNGMRVKSSSRSRATVTRAVLEAPSVEKSGVNGAALNPAEVVIEKLAALGAPNDRELHKMSDLADRLFQWDDVPRLATKQTFTVYELNEFDRDSPAFLELSRQSVNKIDPDTGAHIKALGDQVPFTNKLYDPTLKLRIGITTGICLHMKNYPGRGAPELHQLPFFTPDHYETIMSWYFGDMGHISGMTLWKLNVSINGLSGAVPASLGTLSRLRMLDFSNNAFTGEIPADLFQYCDTLRYVSLAENRFSGPIPGTLWNCSTLEGVNVAFNAFQGAVPPELSNLVRLQFMDLHHNNLTGAIPAELAVLANLTYLDLAANAIGGTIPPEIGRLAKLQSLSLANMELRGAIPASFANLSSLQRLDLSANNLTGAIPVELGEITGLQELYLENNSLNGTIPATLGSLVNLTRFNVSYNALSGRIPTSNAFVRFDNSSYLGNQALCGPPLTTPCEVAVPSPSPSPSVIVTHTTRRLLSVSALIAIAAAGAIALGVVLITLASIWAMRKQAEPPRTEILVYESTPPSPDQPVPVVGKLVLFNKTLPTRFEDWETGTKALLNKECLIGRGSMGTVYRATFDDEVSIAIKRLETLGRIKNADEFESDMDYLGELRHPNLITLQGYYWSSSMQLMLSDYVPNGTLASHLHPQALGAQTTLVWSRRFRIAIGMARGLAYLHHDLRTQVLHLNLSSTNILLDMSFEPKISDFGVMKLSPLLDAYTATRKQGTARAYAAPELLAGSNPSVGLNPKCDVYSFGMVLLELVTGRHPDADASEAGNSLAEFVIRTLESGNGPDCFDPRLTLFPESEVVQVLKLALVCTAQVPANRPTMGEAVQVLDSVKPSGSWTSRSPSP